MKETEEFISLILDSLSASLPITVVFSKATGDAPVRQKARPKMLNGKTVLVFEEEYPFGRVAQKNTDISDVCEKIAQTAALYGQINLCYGNVSCELLRSKKGKITLIGDKNFRRAISESSGAVIENINRKKEYAISSGEPFLFYLGISDKDGRIHDKKQAKYRQINSFIENVENVYYAMPKDGTLIVYDLCCGKSYLSFAVYFYLTTVKKRDVRMICIDQRAEVIDYCSDIARKSGFCGMEFICDDVKNTPKDAHPNLLISLHACDIATDLVLKCGIEDMADVMLLTPCCHRYLNDKINNRDLAFVTSYPHLRVKICEVLTDSIRIARLRKSGYSVTVCELTDPENTPKNTLIRAIRNKNFDPLSERAEKLDAEYERILDFVMGENSKDYLKEIL